MKTLKLLPIVAGVAGMVVLPAAEMNREDAERRLRLGLSGKTGEYGHGLHSMTASEFALKVATQANLSQTDLRAILLKLTEEGVSAAVANRETDAYYAAQGALGALARIGDAAMFPRLAQIAEVGPRRLLAEAEQAVAYVGIREAVPELPAVVARLAPVAESGIYPEIQRAVENQPAPTPGERDHRAAVMVEIFKQELRKPNSRNRTFLDEVLARYDATFRTSEERRRFLTELSLGENPVRKKYADAKLGEVFLTATASPPPSQPSAAQTKQTSAASGAKAPMPASKDQAPITNPADSDKGFGPWPWLLAAIALLFTLSVVFAKRK